MKTFRYRNLMPLYAEEKLKICARRSCGDNEKYDVWIENKEGSLAVRGSAELGQVQD